VRNHTSLSTRTLPGLTGEKTAMRGAKNCDEQMIVGGHSPRGK
jgi:hypothetical protein